VHPCVQILCSDPTRGARTHLQVLFERPFYEYMHHALRAGGVVCVQAESLWLHMSVIQTLAEMCRDVFEGGSTHYAFTTIPTYPSGQIGFMLCAKSTGSTPVDLRQPRRDVPAGTCRYYSPLVHQAAFVLPQFALEALSAYLTFQR
jgi:spermidine synthase